MKVFFSVLFILVSTPSFAISGLQSAAGGGDSASCEGMGLESNVGQWCEAVWKILSDPSTCAGEEVAKPKVALKGASTICPSAGDGLSKEHWHAIIMSMIQVESSGKCETTGDAGGKSQGLLQSTDGDRAPNPKSAQECSGDQKQCEVGLKCGMCLALSNANASGALYEDSGEGEDLISAADFVQRWMVSISVLLVPSAYAAQMPAGANPGLARMFGPWRPSNKAHSKQLDLAKKACAAARPSSGNSGFPGGPSDSAR